MSLVAQMINGKSLLLQDEHNAILIGAVGGERFENLYEIMISMKKQAEAAT